MKNISFLAVLSMSFVASCSESKGPAASPEVASPIELQAVDARADWLPTGIAWDPATERLYVLDGWRGIYVLDRHGALLDRIEITPPDGRTLNDLVLADGTLFTGSDVAGYRIDLATSALTPFFCLLPPDPGSSNGAGGNGGAGGAAGSGGSGGQGGAEPPPPCSTHRNAALAFDAESGRLLSAPQFFDCGSDVASRSELQSYDLTTGVRLSGIPLGEPVYLRGLARDSRTGELLAANEGQIVTLDAAGRIGASTLGAMNFGDIEGIALDTDGGGLFVLDGEHARITRVVLP